MSSRDDFDAWEAMVVKQLRGLKLSLVLEPIDGMLFGINRFDCLLARPSMKGLLLVN
jgi:hypothetical protein